MKQRLDDDIEAAEAGLHADAERELWNFREVFRPSIQNFRYRKFAHFFVIPPPKVSWGLWQKRRKRQVSCIVMTTCEHFFTKIFKSKFWWRMDELCMKYQIIQVLFSTFKFCFQNSSSMRTSVRISSLPSCRFRVVVMEKPFDGAKISPK